MFHVFFYINVSGAKLCGSVKKGFLWAIMSVNGHGSVTVSFGHGLAVGVLMCVSFDIWYFDMYDVLLWHWSALV